MKETGPLATPPMEEQFLQLGVNFDISLLVIFNESR